MGSEDVEDQRRHTAVTLQNGCLKAQSESRGKHGITLDGEDWYDVRHVRLIITPDGTAKEEETEHDSRVCVCETMPPSKLVFFTWRTLLSALGSASW